MRLHAAYGLLTLFFVAAAGCGGGDATPMTGSGGSGGGSGGSGGGSGGSSGTGGAGTGGSQSGTGGSGGMQASGGSSGSGGTAGVDAAVSPDSGGGNAGTDAAGGAAGTDGGAPQTFNCTLILGAGQTLQWFNGGGFQATVGDARWEIRATDNTFTEAWANPNNGFWNVAVQSPCTANPAMPDRVVLIVYSRTLTTQADWEAQIGMVMTNIKTKYPSVQKIELLTFARGPDNMMCGTAVASTVSAAQDQAMQAVAERSAGMIKVGPKYFVPTCAAFAVANNTNLTTAGAMAVAQMLSAVYR